MANITVQSLMDKKENALLQVIWQTMKVFISRKYLHLTSFAAEFDKQNKEIQETGTLLNSTQHMVTDGLKVGVAERGRRRSSVSLATRFFSLL